MNEHNKRSLAKAISWRVWASLTTMLIVFVFTGNWVVSAGVGGVEALAKVLLYVAHERAWSRISWGYRWDKGK